jgi:predicted ATPase
VLFCAVWVLWRGREWRCRRLDVGQLTNVRAARLDTRICSIVEFLRTKSALLLVVDNCEHLVSAAAALAADILRSCRGVRILATSRQALDVGGEQAFGLRPLSLPPPAASMAAAAASDAVSLFVQRATAARLFPDSG